MYDFITELARLKIAAWRDKELDIGSLHYRETSLPESQFLRPLVNWGMLLRFLISVWLLWWLVPALF